MTDKNPLPRREVSPAAADRDRGTGTPSTEVDVVIVGGGPAGLSAALNLGRARASVVLVDAGRPRNAATLRSHGFLTRDGVPPLELRKLARAELAAYPNVRVLDRAVVSGLLEQPGGDGLRFIAALQGRGNGIPPAVAARSVLVATGLRETLPAIPSLRAFYGMTVFSCAACDAWELQDRPLALIGETRDLAARARLIARWTDRLTVFTNGSDAVDTVEEAELAASGIIVERRVIDDLEGDRGTVTAVRLVDGARVGIDGGFVRPQWHPALDFVGGIDLERDGFGNLVTDRSGRTSVPGLYAAGDAASPGPQQLIVAAGQGARAAAVMVHDLIGVSTAH
ncbi:NAD(P)/FAD-dependent oxidoreductase [Microbacterium sp. NPDC056569]|uniref:NAD(P)/FAD-dependent oxidoreductase n=1 Tax=Microbacterium sp. NPDC056569 TaxID=3345867 RepID=UPI00366FC51C